MYHFYMCNPSYLSTDLGGEVLVLLNARVRVPVFRPTSTDPGGEVLLRQERDSDNASTSEQSERGLYSCLLQC